MKSDFYLIRDNVPALSEEKGHPCPHRVLSPELFCVALLGKMNKEFAALKEAIDRPDHEARKKELVSTLIELYGSLDAFMFNEAIVPSDVFSGNRKKRDELGEFRQRYASPAK